MESYNENAIKNGTKHNSMYEPNSVNCKATNEAMELFYKDTEDLTPKVETIPNAMKIFDIPYVNHKSNGPIIELDDPIRNFNFNDKLKELREIKKVVLDRCKSQATRFNEYRNRQQLNLLKENYKKLDKINKRIDMFCKEIENYSAFKIDDLGKILAELITIFEGEKYSYQKTHVMYKDDTFDSLDLIVLNNLKKYNYKSRYYYSLTKNGNAIDLQDSNIYINYVLFYEADTYLHRIKQNTRFGKLPYVKEFIDLLISYKIENEIEDLSKEQLQEFLNEFVKARIDKINYNYQILKEYEQKRNDEIISHNEKVRERKLNKILTKKSSQG
ncbi:MAG: hypothetical protein IJO32_07310 [Bacilli bacterium]|nr:hypothetical protein [Bacilli bacterium]